MHEKIIVAADFGTSGIVVVAAKKNEKGILSVLSVEAADSKGSILRGRIYNQEEVVAILSRSILSLNKKHDLKIEKIYAGGGGQSTHSVPYIIERELTDESEVNQKMLDSMLEECLNHEIEGGVVLGAVSPEYHVDGRQERNPRGVQCRKITAKYQLIVGRTSLERSLYEVTKKAGIMLAGIIPSVEAVSEAVLTAPEKEAGCVLIDFGAGTTDVAVYQNRLLRFLSTIPLGGEVITKDLMSLNMTQIEAEEYKMEQGLTPTADNDFKSQALTARTDEILTNIMVQLKRAGFEKIPAEGIVITGGGALLKNLPEAIRERLKCKVRLANAKDSLFIQESKLIAAPGYALVSGLLSLGKDNCASVEVKQTQPQPIQHDLFGNTQQTVEKPKEAKPKRPDERKTNKEGFLERFKNKVGKGVDGVSRSLFDDEN